MGRLARGENGHGMAMRMINKEIVYQIIIVLNFNRSVPILLVFADPIVSTTTATTINKIWTYLKNTCSSITPSTLGRPEVNFTIGLIV